MISCLKVYKNISGQNNLGSVASEYVVTINSPAGEMKSPISESTIQIPEEAS